MTACVVTCPECHGLSSLDQPCYHCHGSGRRRAHLVLTVANIDTGAVASASLQPGRVRPLPGPHGQWWINVSAVVDDLARQVKATTIVDLSHPDEPLDPDHLLSIPLPHHWRPSASEATRWLAEAEALATHVIRPWRVFLGYGPSERAAKPTSTSTGLPDPVMSLQRLCVLADLLRLDLVVEVRVRTLQTGWSGPTWEIRYELPGSGVPLVPLGVWKTLSAAVVGTTPLEAFRQFGRDRTGEPAPAHWVTPLGGEHIPPIVDLAEIERQITWPAAVVDSAGVRLGDTVGGQAIWRDGQWHYVTLRDTGSGLVRGHEPPPPPWLGQPIPFTTYMDDQGITHRAYEGAVLTVTDFAGRVAHRNWRPERGIKVRRVEDQPGCRPVAQLPERYQLGGFATAFGVRGCDLTDLLAERPAPYDLRYGYVRLADPQTEDSVAARSAELTMTYLQGVTQGRPGARVLIYAGAPEVPPLGYLIRLAEGLSVGIEISVYDGELWSVELTPAEFQARMSVGPIHPSVEHAIAFCLRFLDGALSHALPADPESALACPNAQPSDPIRTVPRAPGTSPQEDIVRVLARVAKDVIPASMMVRRDPTGWRVFEYRPGGQMSCLASAPTLPQALAGLVAPITD